MVFSSSFFLFGFLPVLLLIYYISDKRFKNIILLAASLFFYAWGEPKNVVLMLLSIAVNYLIGIRVEESLKYKKVYLTGAIVYNLFVLFIFKYLNFAVDTINNVSGSNIQIAEIALPIGISFYTFQIMSYVVDVYRENVKAQRNILNLALYVSLFPQLIAGPIVRYVDVEKQIEDRYVSLDGLRIGVLRFAIGFSKKVLIADQLSGLADLAFAGEYPSLISNWFGIIAYTLQIFFDFSGYSDMAIGLGRMFGFDFLENFDFPYISESIQEFWRRWHISLGSWFRDYLYIPLGGSRKGNIRTYVNLVIVFFMTGLWHGASFNFIVWGLFYVVFMIIERMGFNKILNKLPAFLRHIYAIIIIVFGWVFFRADTLTAAVEYIYGMFVPSGSDAANFIHIINPLYIFCIAAGIFFCVPHERIKRFFERSDTRRLFGDLLTCLVFVIAVCYMVGSGYSPFLYFRF